MPYYTVYGFATYAASIEVEADSPEEAREIVKAMRLRELREVERDDLFEFELDESNAPELVG